MKKTFIKMQSLSRKAWLCGGLIAMAAALVGCSSDAPDPGDNPDPAVAQTDGDPLTIISDQATLSGLVLNYATGDEELDDPQAFKLEGVPDYLNAKDIKDAVADGKIISGGKVKILTDYKGNLDANGNSIELFIVSGTFEGDIINGGAVKVHILEGGMWKAGTTALSTPNLEIYEYDNDTDLVCPDSFTMRCSYYGKEFNQSGKEITLGEVGEKGDKNTKGGIFVEGAIIAKTLTMLGNKMLINAKCLIVEDASINSHNNAKNYVGSYISANNLTMGEKAQFLLGNKAYVRVENNLVMVKNSLFKVTDGHADIKVANLYTNDRSQGNDKPKKANNGEGSFNMGGKFKDDIDVYIGKLYEGVPGSCLEREIGKINGTNDVTIFHPIDEFNGNDITECPSSNGGGDNPVNPDPTPNPFTNMPEVIIEITGKEDDNDHTHPISATGIDVSGNKAYISWHERGGNIRGCIETIEINPTDKGGYEAKVTSWMETDEWIYPGDLSGATASTAYDFNHIIYDQIANSLLTVGEHAKKGGIIGRIKLGEAFGENAELNIFENRQLGVEKWSGKENQGLVAGGSGNCVVISPDRTKLLVASRGGYLAIPYDSDPFVREDGKHIVTSKDIKSLVTDGSAKHLALYDDGQLVSIEYTVSSENADWWEDNTTALPAKIYLWKDWKNFPNKDPQFAKYIEVPAFSPVFGKDVIAMDDEYIYSCQGHNGVVIYNKSSLQEEARFNVDSYIREHRDYFTKNHIFRMTGAAANGLAVDDQYLYIAYGGAGLWVLNKVTFEPVGFYVTAGTYPENESKKASANYVRVMEDGKVVVAYGRDGVKVLKVKSTPKDSKM